MREKRVEHDELLGISLNQIRIFLEAAGKENVSRAARELHLTQAYVSKNISNLEEKTGLILFSRNASYVKLTDAGRNLYEEWSRAYRKLLDSVDISLEVQRESFHMLRIGDNSELKGNIYICPFIQDFQTDNSGLSLNYDQESLVLLIEDLIFGKYDMIFCSAMQIPELEEARLEWLSVFPDKLCVAVSNNHPLASCEHISIADLQGETFVMIDRDVWPGYYSAVADLVSRHGGEISSTYFTDTTHSAFLATLCQKGVLICDRMFYPSYECYFKKYDIDGEAGGVVVAWDKNNPNPHIMRFIHYIKSRI